MKRIQVGDFTYSIPGSWDELSNRQLKRIMRYLCSPDPKYIISLNILIYLFGMKRRFFFPDKASKNIAELSDMNKYTLIHSPQVLGWLWEADGLHYALPHIKVKGKYYFGPSGDMCRTAAQELMFAHTFFYLYSTTQEVKYLDKLIALLYRPSKSFNFLRKRLNSYNPDRRVAQSYYLFKKREDIFEKIPFYIKAIILKQFSSSWAEFQEKFPLVFSNDPNKSDYDSNKWFEILYDLSNGAFGTLEATEKAPAERVFKAIEREIQKSLDMKDRSSN